MVLLEDTIYADLRTRARRAEVLERENASLKSEAEAQIASLRAEIERLSTGIISETPGEALKSCSEPVVETREEQERRFELLRLQAENQRLKEKLGLAVRRIFGPKSERNITGQEASLFNEAEAEAAPDAPDPLKQVAGYLRGKKKPGQRELQLGGLEIREVEYTIAVEDQLCPLCGEPMHEMGDEEYLEVEIDPIVVRVIRKKRAKYCCGKPDNHPMKTSIVRAPLPPTAFPKSLATPSAVAHIMHEKYVMGSPLYRQEQDLARLGFPLSRQTMANWVIAGASLLDHIFLRLQAHLLKEEVLHSDETRMQVLHEEGKLPTIQSSMWLYRTGRFSHPIVLYDYQPTKAQEHPTSFLNGYRGYLQVDGTSAYDKLPGVTLSGCWAHARRKFVEAIETLPKARRDSGGTKSHEGMEFCNKLFEIERELHDLAPAERKVIREERSRPVLNEFRTWLDATAIHAVPKSPLGAAIKYCIRQWSKLIAFMEDGRLEIDNNAAERAIKGFVIGRKNWLFANAPTGADASATVYSIVETAKENNLDPRKYLQFLFEQLPLIKKINPKQLDELLPWEPAAQNACKVQAKNSE